MRGLTRIFIALLLALTGSALAGSKYPLTMTAVFTEGKIANPTRTTYHSGDYDCTEGDEHNAPVCRTLLEWAELDSMGGTPTTVEFTLEDGAKVGVQSQTLTKVPGYIECGPGTSVIFCALYFDLLGRTMVEMRKPARYGQSEYMSADEYQAATRARRAELFGDKKSMTVRFRYRLKGKPEKDDFQRIEVDPSSCTTDSHGTNSCRAGNDSHLFNARGDGYYVKLAEK